MAIVNNVSDALGDVLIIRSSTPVVGIVSLTSYTDVVTGTWTKEFRYTVDGINYSDWDDLTDVNVAAISISPTNAFVVEYRYTNAANATASFTSVTLNGTYTVIECGTTYENSIFNDFFTCTDAEVLTWCIAVTNKLYKQGIIPSYLERGDNGNKNGEDDDYLDFWKSVSCLFAYIVVFARKIKDFKDNDRILSEFLRQWEIYFCGEDSLGDKVYLVENYFDQIRQRGTELIYKTAVESGKGVNGELLRLICYNEDDEFIFNLHLPHSIGWSIGNSSPIYQSCENQPATNKAYEDTQDFVSLTPYPTFGNGTQAIITDGSKEVYSILNIPDTETAGIGLDDVANYGIVVDPNLDYEVTFWVRQPVAEANLSFGINAYDVSDVLSVIYRVDTGAVESNFFDSIQLANTTDYFFVRGILYSKDRNAGQTGTGTISSTGTAVTGAGTSFTTELVVGDLIEADGQKKKVISITDNTNLTVDFAFDSDLSSEAFTYHDSNAVDPNAFGGGVNLKMNADTVRIIPSIILDNTAGGDAVNELRIWDLKVRPLNTTYSTGFVNPKNFVSLWLKHNNSEISRNQLEDRLRRFLLPYSVTSGFRINYLNDDFTITS